MKPRGFFILNIMKKCSKCREIEENTPFNKKGSVCKKCDSEYKKNHYQKSKDTYLQKSKEWKLNNKEKVKISDKKNREAYKEENYLRSKIWQKNNKEKVCEKSKKWQKNNKEKFNAGRLRYDTERKRTDSVFALKLRIRTLISTSVKRLGYSKNSQSFKILGCDYVFFKQYIESQFTGKMQWSNIHLDHIRPISLAKTEKEVLDLNHYTNFQPLLAKDNLSKGSKLIEKQLRLL